MKQRKKLIMLCGLMLAVSSPTYAENATEAVSISDTASVVELTSDANMETEMQSVSDSDTTETSAQETDQVALPAIWQETYTYLADTQDAHTFPEQIEKSGTSYQLKDVQYQITELTKEYSKSSVDLWAYAEYTPEQEIEVDGLHYTLVDTSKEEWTKNGRSKTVSVERTYLDGQEVPESIDIESTDKQSTVLFHGQIGRMMEQIGGKEDWNNGSNTAGMRKQVSGCLKSVMKVFRQRPMTVHGLMVVKIRFCNRSIWMEHSIKLLELHGIVRAGRKQMAAGGNP